ncbi:unnamed protein product [Leptidea sinapis]|uniref:Uncharacterized protein n=1 Tax=Leptidea sinapis TaxID=189913 RepID=A0A5E4QR72_9NEOP|nr:unnamed protein product [Leptidea sinapis]
MCIRYLYFSSVPILEYLNQQLKAHPEDSVFCNSNVCAHIKYSLEYIFFLEDGNHSHPSLSNTTSINSIATDVTCTHLPDSLDAKIEVLLRDWHQSPDLLFSIHPVDGSFLIWSVGAIRQAQVSFSARIPAAFPLGDAGTMCTPAALYHAAAQPLHVRHRTRPVTHATDLQQQDAVTTPLASVQEEKEEQEWPQPEQKTETQENVPLKFSGIRFLSEKNLFITKKNTLHKYSITSIIVTLFNKPIFITGKIFGKIKFT